MKQIQEIFSDYQKIISDFADKHKLALEHLKSLWLLYEGVAEWKGVEKIIKEV